MYTNNKNTRLLALLLVLVLACPAFAACGNAETATETEATTETLLETAEESTELIQYNAPDVQYEDTEIMILDYDTDEYFWQAATYSDICADELTGDPINDAQFKRNVQVEEELGVIIETHPVGGVGRGSNGSTLKTFILASDDTIDAAFLFATELKSILAEPGYLLDLYTVPNLDPSASYWDQSGVENFTFGDGLKAITGDISIYAAFAPELYFYNKAVAEEHKLEDMYELVREGKWTHDVVFRMCEQVSYDVDGNGIMDENDAYGMANQRNLMSDVLVSSGVRYTEKQPDGSLKLALNTEKTVDIINDWVPFFNNESVSIIADLYQKKYSNPFYEMHMPMFKNNQILFNFNQILISFELREMDTDFGLLPMPKCDESQSEYLTSMSTSWLTMLCVPVTSGELDKIGHVLSALGYYSKHYVTPEFIDRTVRHKSLRDDNSAEMLEIILSSRTYDIAQVYNWGNVLNIVNSLSVNNSTDFASSYTKGESAVLTDMEKTFPKN